MKVVIFGPGGLLGEALARIGLESGHTVVEASRMEVNLEEQTSLKRFLNKNPADCYIYAAGLTGLEACLDDPQRANTLNVDSPTTIALAAKSQQAKFIYYSTDYVYSGVHEEALTELVHAGPINTYGKSKLAGERSVQEVYDLSLVLRVSWLFGSGRDSFVDGVVKSLLKNEERKYISDKWSVPNWTDDLAFMSYSLLELEAHGVVHLLSNGGTVSWYEYALQVADTLEEHGVYQRNGEIIKKSKMAEVSGFRDKRPVSTGMSSSRIVEEFGLKLPDWRRSLSEYLRRKCVSPNE